MRTMRTTVTCCFGILSFAALLMPTASFAERPEACANIASSAASVPADLAELCGGAGEKSPPSRTPSDLATSPDGVLTQCASMTLGVPENVSTVGSIQFRPACDFANNNLTTLYCMTFDVPAAFSSVDVATCAETPIGTASNFQNFSGMAWDFTTGTMYGSTTDINTSNLYTIDLTTGATTLVGEMTNSPGNIAIGIDVNGDLYGYDIVLDSLLSHNKANGAGTVIGPLGFDANFAQSMDFDHSDNTCYIFAFNNITFQAELRTCDVGTGATTLVGVIGQNTPGGLQEWTGAGVLVNDGGGGCEAEIRVPGEFHAPGSKVPVNFHIVHRNLDYVTKAWNLMLLDSDGRPVARVTLPPRRLEPFVPYDGQLELTLPRNLPNGTYTVWLGLPDMRHIKGAKTTIRVVGAQ